MLETQKKIRRSQLKAGILGGMLLLCIVLLATIIFGSSSNAAEEDIPDAILAASQQFVTAYGQADLDVMMTFLTRDARWFFPLGNTFSGVEEIKNIYETGIRHGTAKIELERLHLEVHGNTATEFRRFLHRRADGSIQSWGLSTVIWKIEDDKWKIHRLTWLPKG